MRVGVGADDGLHRDAIAADLAGEIAENREAGDDLRLVGRLRQRGERRGDDGQSRERGAEIEDHGCVRMAFAANVML